MVKDSSSRRQMLDRIERATAEIASRDNSLSPVNSEKVERIQAESATLTPEEKAALFIENLRLGGGEGCSFDSEENLKKQLEIVLKDYKDQTVIITGDPELERLNVPDLIRKIHAECMYQRDIQLERAEKAALGITTAQAGITDTGTIVLFHTSETGRLAGLLPPVHLVLLKRENLFQNKSEYIHYFQTNGIDLGSTPMSWITGPSLTADIEKILVRGAHGPRRVIVFLY